MKYPKIPLAQQVIQLCAAKGIYHVVISPGSRNAPLTIGFSVYKKVKTYSVVDERCAAFFAMGIAQEIQQPVAVVCTSGSAMLNYYPAIAEAFYSKVPLIVISADRPKYLIDVGDGQTIRQENVFANHILTIISNWINNQKLTDAHTCYKMFSRNIFDKINLEESGFSFCPEITTKVSNLNILIHEISINYNGRTYDEGKKITFMDGFKALYTIFKYSKK